ncbi:MAG: cbb3-type cytochrome c oxidase subunit 3 [Silicimonas sp.]|nr:cbb3-type cytochrome c oxidase subunit 3 [Silicimonas sp.]
MDTYSFLRELADSWVLLGMTVFYIGAIIWAFRPGSRAVHDDIANIPFRNDEAPCAKKCDDCACSNVPNFTPNEVA